MSFRGWATLLALIGTTGCAARQSSGGEGHDRADVEYVAVNQFFTALERQDWAAVIRLLHPAALANFKAEYRRLAALGDFEGAHLRVHLEEQFSSLPDTVTALADSLSADTLPRDTTVKDSSALATFGFASFGELDELTEHEALRRWLQSPQAYSAAPRTIIGVAFTADSVSSMFYHKYSRIGPDEIMSDLRVITIRRTTQGLRIIPPASM